MGTVARVPLGRSGLAVAPIAFGGNVLGWTADEPRSFDLLDAFVEAGFNLIDTADVYSQWVPGHSGGESETILGHWLAERGRRSDVVIATKVGMEQASGGKGLSRRHILASVAASRDRLGVDAIDLYQSHTDDEATPIAETLEAYRDLIDRGEVRAIGASNFTAARLSESLDVSRAQGLPSYQSLQPRYNLMDRTDFEPDLAGLCQRRGLAVLTYSSLASGFLSGKYRSAADLGKSPRGARAGPRLDERGHRILAALDDIAADLGSAPATVALAWLLTRPAVTAAIASATSLAQFREIAAATQLRLPAGAVERLTVASA